MDNLQEQDFEAQTEALGRTDDPAAASTGYEPHENDFETDFNFVNPEGIKRDANRYIWFGGNLITAAMKRTRADFRLGGEYYGQDFPALAISKYILHRARITPLTLRPRPFSADEPITNREVEVFDGQLQLPGGQPAPRVQFVKTYPYDQLEAIVFGARDDSGKGVVELTAFQGLEYGEDSTKALINQVQQTIFPNWVKILRGEAELPVTLRGLEELIGEAGAKHAEDPFVATTCQEMLAGCAQFRAWGVNYLQSEGTRIRAGVNPQGGYVHRYSPVAELLLVQLEMKRENLLELPSAPAAPQDTATADALIKLAEATMAAVETNRELVRSALAVANGGAGAAAQTEETEKAPRGRKNGQN